MNSFPRLETHGAIGKVITVIFWRPSSEWMEWSGFCNGQKQYRAVVNQVLNLETGHAGAKGVMP